MADDGLGQRMLAAALGGRRDSEQLALLDAGHRLDARHSRPAASDRAGLVEDDGGDALGVLEGGAVADENPVLGTLAGADHDGRRRREPHGARAGDDQDGDCARQRGGELRLGPQQQPAGERHRGDADDRRHEPPRDPIRQALDGCLRALCTLHQCHDLGERRVAAHPLRAHHERSAGVDGRADDRVADALLDRQRLAGQHRLVHGRGTVDQDPVDRHPIAGAYPHEITRHDLVHRDLALPALAQDAGRIGSQLQQGPDRAGRPALGTGLEPAAEQDETDDQRRRVEVGLMPDAGRHDLLGQQGDEHRVPICRQRADRDQGVHVRLAVPSAPKRCDQEAPAEDELHDGGGNQEPAVDVDHRPRRTAGGEHDRHHHGADPERDDRACQELPSLARPLRLIGRDRLVISGAGGRIAAHVIPSGLDGRHDAGAVDSRRVEADRGALGREVHVCLSHSVGASEKALDAVHAARARHADDGQRQLRGVFEGRCVHRLQHTTGEYLGRRHLDRRESRESGGFVPRIPTYPHVIATDSSLARRSGHDPCTVKRQNHA